MAEKEKQPAEFTHYAFANVASQMYDKRDTNYIKGTLSLLEKNIPNLDLDKVELFNWFTNHKQEKELTGIFNKRYETELEKATVGEVFDFYSIGLEGASDEQKALITQEFGKFAGENYVKFTERLNTLNLKASGKLKNIVSEEEQKKAIEEIQPYLGFMQAHEKLMKESYEELRFKGVRASRKDTYGGDLEKILTANNQPAGSSE